MGINCGLKMAMYLIHSAFKQNVLRDWGGMPHYESSGNWLISDHGH